MATRNLECNCCGSSAGRFAQWWNRDTGYGQCGACSDWSLERGETLAHIKDMAGNPGEHRPIGPIETALREQVPNCDTLPLSALRAAVAGILESMGEGAKAAQLRAKAAQDY
jgi:hypothetical protein